jgi:hypothetical protein
VLSAAPGTTLPPLQIMWSVNNRPAEGDPVRGEIGTSYFTVDAAGRSLLYLLGAENTDTDEHDATVVAHELGHFLQSAVSRDDSVGGQHAAGDKLDMRVAFSEGFGNAWGGFVVESPFYRDSSGSLQSQGFSIDLSSPPSLALQGWYSETAVHHLLWESLRDPAIGWPLVYSALTRLRSAPTFTSIHAFNVQLRTVAPASASIIAARASAQGVAGWADAWGGGETNNGGHAPSLPIYATHTAVLGSGQRHCVASPFGTPNKLGNHAFVRFTLASSGARSFTIQRSSDTTGVTDPDVTLLTADGQVMVAESADVNAESFQVTLPAGTHALAIKDYNLVQSGRTSCFDLFIE